VEVQTDGRGPVLQVQMVVGTHTLAVLASGAYNRDDVLRMAAAVRE
jgi:hypothetical protein